MAITKQKGVPQVVARRNVRATKEPAKQRVVVNTAPGKPLVSTSIDEQPNWDNNVPFHTGRDSVDNSLDNLRVSSPPLPTVSPMPSKMSTTEVDSAKLQNMSSFVPDAIASPPPAMIVNDSFVSSAASRHVKGHVVKDQGQDAQSVESSSTKNTTSSQVPKLHLIPSLASNNESVTEDLRPLTTESMRGGVNDAFPAAEQPYYSSEGDGAGSSSNSINDTAAERQSLRFAVPVESAVDIGAAIAAAVQAANNASPDMAPRVTTDVDTSRPIMRKRSTQTGSVMRRVSSVISASMIKSISLDVPADVVVIDRKQANAALVAANLESKGIATSIAQTSKGSFARQSSMPKLIPTISAKLVEEEGGDNKQSDDASDEISFYFDRTAPSKVAEKPRPEKRKMSKRLSRVESKAEYLKRTEAERKAFEEELARLAAEWDPTEDMNPDEVAKLKRMSAADREKYLAQLRAKAKGGDHTDVSVASSEASAASSGKKNVALTPVLEVELIVVSENHCAVNVSSDLGCPVFVVLTSAVVDNIPASPLRSPIKLWNADLINENTIPGLLKCKSVLTRPGHDKTPVVFDHLQPNMQYCVYVLVDSPSAIYTDKQVMLVDDEFDDHPHVDVVTFSESNEVEWTSMSVDLQRVELRAAVRSKFVSALAAGQSPPIILPTDEEITSKLKFADQVSREAASRGSITSGEVKRVKTPASEQAAAAPDAWPNFLAWWTGSRTPLSLSSKSMPITSVRKNFLTRELVFAITSKSIMKKYLEEGYADSEEVDALLAYAKGLQASLDTRLTQIITSTAKQGLLMPEEVASNAIDEATRKGLQAGPECFSKFCSWYKGGQVFNAKHQDAYPDSITDQRGILQDGASAVPLAIGSGPNSGANSGAATPMGVQSRSSSRPVTGKSSGGIISVTATSRPTTASSVRNPFEKRTGHNVQLDVRNAFLLGRIAEVDKCCAQVRAVIDAHKFGVLKRLKSEDLETKRASLSARV
jgi:hypothetical protein